MKTAFAVAVVLGIGGVIVYEIAKPYLEAGQAFKKLGGVAGDIKGITGDVRGITSSASSIFGSIKGWFGDSPATKSGGSGDGLSFTTGDYGGSAFSDLPDFPG